MLVLLLDGTGVLRGINLPEDQDAVEVFPKDKDHSSLVLSHEVRAKESGHSSFNLAKGKRYGRIRKTMKLTS
jgi:hypothetical protein